MGLFSKKKPAAASSPAASTPAAPSSRTQRPTTSNGQQQQQQQTPTIPEAPVPAGPSAEVDPVAYLKSLPSIRARASQVYAARNNLAHFTFNEKAIPEVVDFVVSIIKRDYGSDHTSIPPHGRWQHFNVGGAKRVEKMMAAWSGVPQEEQTRRVLDLFLVSVLLDAGAGNAWSYKAENGRLYRRSEGLAVASLEMFTSGAFSSNAHNKMQVDAEGLASITPERMASGLQVTQSNPMSGLEGRTSLLSRLSHALKQSPELFGTAARPGHLLDYLQSHPSSLRSEEGTSVPVTLLWSALMEGLASIWPVGRTHLDGNSLGDAWPYSRLPTSPPHASIVPFHKLSQWLAYSLMQPMTALSKIHFSGAGLLTGLPEYRNGGLFIDLGVLTLRREAAERGLEQFKQNAKLPGQQSVEVVPTFEPMDDVIVEWRAMTVCLLDVVHAQVNKKLGLSGQRSLSLPQVLEAGTWKAGREIAEVQRPNTRGSPLAILSDGTVF
ncbi:hypothetical protein BCR37DRAFT_350034 [Protomyces lactucae-debilis]|uniref:DUF1688 domain-containing protein n=1 Tax=Protomyces lactucae-debilis TaxID=2754530 RepID=A0A1Y2F587_PROLT|nr:uncharacterized protein BCR37DRAFT_350034 [Protomyces lactucae-debilis]ORY79013.1 hypothetical protein BCR37DRAFT_350034 [Protomyces lactucae-debilis]